jgi:hypothetical protein
MGKGITSFIENSTLRVGGNSVMVSLGNRVIKFSDKINNWANGIIRKNKPTLVTNPVGKLINPFTLLINFTVDSNQKYQIVLQGDYKDKYRESENGEVDLSENELFMIINSNVNSWFKKE